MMLVESRPKEKKTMHPSQSSKSPLFVVPFSERKVIAFFARISAYTPARDDIIATVVELSLSCFFPNRINKSDSLLPAGGVLLEHLLDNLLLLDEESADDAVLDAVGAAGTTVGTLDGLLGAGDLGVLAGTESRDL